MATSPPPRSIRAGDPSAPPKHAALTDRPGDRLTSGYVAQPTRRQDTTPPPLGGVQNPPRARDCYVSSISARAISSSPPNASRTTALTSPVIAAPPRRGGNPEKRGSRDELSPALSAMARRGRGWVV